MAKIYKSAAELVGNTPLVELVNLEKQEGLRARLLAKLEYLNPAGSVKDRVGKAMIEAAEQEGGLSPVRSSLSPLPEIQASDWQPLPPPRDIA